MSGEIKQSFELLAQSAKTIQAERNQFAQINKHYLTDTVAALRKMHYSKSAKQLADSLEEMGDVDLSILATKLDQYSKSSAFTGVEIERTDTELAKGFQGDRQHG